MYVCLYVMMMVRMGPIETHDCPIQPQQTTSYRSAASDTAASRAGPVWASLRRAITPAWSFIIGRVREMDGWSVDNMINAAVVRTSVSRSVSHLLRLEREGLPFGFREV